MAMHQPKIVVIEDTDIDKNAVGAFIWWRLSGALKLDVLEKHWQERSLKYPLPDYPSEKTALRRAMGELQDAHRLARRIPDAGEGVTAYCLVDETTEKGQKKLQYEHQLTAWLERDNEKLRFDPEEHSLRKGIEAAYEKHLKTVSSDDTREWLSKIIKLVLAVSLRDTGGVYFIPKEFIADFRSIVEGIRLASDHKIFAVPSQRSEDAVKGILDAIRNEAENQLAALRAQLENGELGAKALQSRIEDCTKQAEKLGRYEALLGEKQEDIQKSWQDMRAHLTEALIKTEAKSES